MIKIRVNDPSKWKIGQPDPDSLRGKAVALAQACDGKTIDEFEMRLRAMRRFRATGENPSTWLTWMEKKNIVRLS